MSGFAIRNPYLILVLCFLVLILGAVSTADMPVDMFPPVDLPVVAVATFYSGMPPQQIETNITYHLERQFTLASGIDHMESRSLPGASLIKVYFRAGINPDAAAASISTLAMSDMRDMPPGTAELDRRKRASSFRHGSARKRRCRGKQHPAGPAKSGEASERRR
jgi:multidrug efflux pump subunit AcrB